MAFPDMGGFGSQLQNNFGSSQLTSFFRGMTGHYQLKPDSTKQYDLTNNYMMDLGVSSQSYNEKQQILKQLNNAQSARTQLIEQCRNLKTNELVQTMISCLINDAFSSVSDNNFISIEYKSDLEEDSKIKRIVQEEIDKFVEEQDLAGLSRDILEDWMLCGEYFLRTKIVKGQGVVDIIDNCDPEDYMGLYKGRKLDCFFKFNRKKNRFELYDEHDLTHFILDGVGRIKIKLETDEDIENLPEQIRMGRSVVYPVLLSLKRLNTLEATAMAMEIKRVLAPILVSVDINPDGDTFRISDIMDKYEGVLNDMNAEATNIDNFNESDLVQIASRIKVIPRFTDGKGGIEQIKFDYDNSDLNNRINDIRKNIALSLGIPSFYLAFGEQMLGKPEMLKVYSSYSKKLIGLQTCFGKGMRNLVWKHLLHKGLFVIENNISVKFKSITSVETQDDVEVMLAVITALGQIAQLAEQVASSQVMGVVIDDNVLIEVFNMYMSGLPKMQGLFKLYDNGEQKPQIPQGEQPPLDIPPAAPQPGAEAPAVNLSAQAGQNPPAGTVGTNPTETGALPPAETPPTGGEVNIGDQFT